jgi:hypothetical protein
LLTFGTSVGLILSIYCELIDEYIDVPLEIAHRRQPSRRGGSTIESVMQIFDGKVDLPNTQSELSWVEDAAFLIENIIKEYRFDALYIAGGRRSVMLKHIDRLEEIVHKLITDQGQLDHWAAVYDYKEELDLFSSSVRSLAIRYL